MESVLFPVRRSFDVGSDGKHPSFYTYTIWMLVHMESVLVLIRIPFGCWFRWRAF